MNATATRLENMSDPYTYEALCNVAEEHSHASRLTDALKLAHQACSMEPGQARAYLIISDCLTRQGDWISALETLEIAHLLNADLAGAYALTTKLLAEIRASNPTEQITRPIPELSAFSFYSKAAKRFLRLQLLEPAGRALALAAGEQTDALLVSAAVNIDASLANWSRYEEHHRAYVAFADPARVAPVVSPLMGLCLSDDRALHLRVAQRFMGESGGHSAVLQRKLRPIGKLNRRPRVGYLSADFHSHATARLMVGMLEHHDRSAWEVFGLSYGRNDGSQLRERTEAAFEHFVEMHGQPAEANLRTIRELGLDILVDAKGLTSGFEASYTVARPAPVVVNYLAYPGTMGSTAYDYILGDPVVTPFEHQSAYVECIAQLPHTYQPNDPGRAIPAPRHTRASCGLPPDAVVFAAFNNVKKVTPHVFAAWMRVLTHVPDAVIWWVCKEEQARQNLRLAAHQHGIDASRMVFADSASQEDHMARYHLVDIFLDTFPYNSHTTASDALWMGVPLVTLQGESFPSRVAASVLTAAGLPELITHTLGDYETMLFQLARDAAKRRVCKDHLLATRSSSSLFDAPRYVQNLEQAFAFMVERSRKGKPPHPFEVRDRASGGGIRLAGGAGFKPVGRVLR